MRALTAAGHTVAVACYFEHIPEMVATYTQAGAEVHLLSDSQQRPTGALNTLRFLRKTLKPIVRSFRPDAAHVQYMAPGALAIIALRTLGIKNIIATAHTAADIYPSLRLIHLLNRHILRAFQCITLIAEKSFFGSAQNFDDITSLKQHDNHFTIYNTLPPEAEIAEAPRSGAPLTIGVVSRLVGIKGMDLVIPAFAQLKKRYPDLHLVVGGDGDLRPAMEQKAKELGVSEAVTFFGRVYADKLQTIYDSIDILLIPSRSEGFGLTAIEGMARGCVPVVSDTGGLPEVIENGVSGLLHKKESVKGIVEQCSALIDRPEEWQRLSAGAITRAHEFTFPHFSTRLRRLYTLLAE